MRKTTLAFIVILGLLVLLYLLYNYARKKKVTGGISAGTPAPVTPDNPAAYNTIKKIINDKIALRREKGYAAFSTSAGTMSDEDFKALQAAAGPSYLSWLENNAKAHIDSNIGNYYKATEVTFQRGPGGYGATPIFAPYTNIMIAAQNMTSTDPWKIV